MSRVLETCSHLFDPKPNPGIDEPGPICTENKKRDMGIASRVVPSYSLN